MRTSALATAIVASTLASACAVVPVTTDSYDPDCRVVTHHMTLKLVQVGLLDACNGDNNCLVGYLAVLGGSAIVSGSVVVVGNVVYWAQLQAACNANGVVQPAS